MPTSADDLDTIAAKVDQQVNGSARVRCSKLALAMTCPASTVTNGVYHDAPSDAADMGTAFGMDCYLAEIEHQGRDDDARASRAH